MKSKICEFTVEWGGPRPKSIYHPLYLEDLLAPVFY